VNFGMTDDHRFRNAMACITILMTMSPWKQDLKIGTDSKHRPALCKQHIGKFTIFTPIYIIVTKDRTSLMYSIIVDY
jgi:hypothetical protein